MNQRVASESRKYRSVAAAIRGKITSGTLQPGARLPTWDQLSVEFSVGRPTLMRAMDRLKRDGFVKSESTRGTFVSLHPPHLTRFGVVFGSVPGRGGVGGWNRFWSAIAAEAEAENHRSERQLVCYYGLGLDDGDAHQRLQADLAHERLAGLIIVGSEQIMRTASIIEAPVPKVAVFNAETSIPRVYVDHDSFMDKAIERLLSEGRKRIAVIRNETDGFAPLLERAIARGAECRPFWSLSASGLHPKSAVNITRLLFDCTRDECPDALVITDDNLVEHTITGLVEAGVRVPQDLQVIAHCNWPTAVPAVLPILRLGFDVKEIVHRCLRSLESGRGVAEEMIRLVPAHFEDEVSPEA